MNATIAPEVWKNTLAVEMDFYTALCIISNVQLASRHPLNNGLAFQNAKQFCSLLGKIMEQKAPELGTIIEMGWQPEFDFFDS